MKKKNKNISYEAKKNSQELENFKSGGEIMTQKQQQGQELEPGSKYLNITVKPGVLLEKAFSAIRDGEENVSFAAFKNTDKEGNQPDYSSSEVSVWVNEKQENTNQEDVV